MRRMGEAGENLEEQLGSMDEELGATEELILGVQKETLEVEEQILEVQERIGRLDDLEEIEKCLDGDKSELLLQGKGRKFQEEKLKLLTEYVQLRDKEIQLLHKENQLWRKKLQLRDQEGQEYHWLAQRLRAPAPPSEPFRYPSNPSSSNYERMWIPVKVEHWDVRDNVEESLNRANKKMRMYDLSHLTVTRNTIDMKGVESYVVDTILSKMQDFMDKKEPLSMFRFMPQVRMLSKKRGENDRIGLGEGVTGSDMVELYVRGPTADHILSLGTKDVVAVEVKKGGLGPDQGDSWNLHKAWTQSTNNKQGEDGSCEALGITPAHREKVVHCVNQLYEYMVLSKVGYGVLTDARNWYLFKRDNAGCLKISTGFRASGEPSGALDALVYLVHTAAEDKSEFGYPVENGRFSTVPEAASHHSKESTNDIVNDPNYQGPGSNKSGSEIPRSGGTHPVEKQMALQDIPAKVLNLKRAGVISCEGWGGYVVAGRLHGQVVALKFGYSGTKRAEALLKEVVAYSKMEKLWGGFVPGLVGYGTTNKGRVVFVATELIKGVILREVAPTEEVQTATLEALDAVHACGLLHGDIRRSNIMVVQGEQLSVRILDFGFSSVTSKKRLQKAERVYLKSVLTDMVMYPGR